MIGKKNSLEWKKIWTFSFTYFKSLRQAVKTGNSIILTHSYIRWITFVLNWAPFLTKSTHHHIPPPLLTVSDHLVWISEKTLKTLDHAYQRWWLTCVSYQLNHKIAHDNVFHVYIQIICLLGKVDTNIICTIKTMHQRNVWSLVNVLDATCQHFLWTTLFKHFHPLVVLLFLLFSYHMHTHLLFSK